MRTCYCGRNDIVERALAQSTSFFPGICASVTYRSCPNEFEITRARNTLVAREVAEL